MGDKYNIIAVGSSEFIMGFRLAGLQAIETASNAELLIGAKKSETLRDPTQVFEELLKENKVGIIVTDDKTINLVDEKVRKKALESVKPVTVVLTLDNSGQEALQKMIKKSLGVDLWK